jgi:hypothetical protein
VRHRGLVILLAEAIRLPADRDDALVLWDALLGKAPPIP